MWTPIIGEDAGKIWQHLFQNGEASVSSLKKSFNLDDRKLYLALGWLAREGKILIEQKKQQNFVSLSDQ
jgi:hypothetical protein